MKEYDVIIVGTGSGATLAENAVAQGMSVALVDKGPVGGTCLNLGCLPTKMMIFPADRIMEIREAGKFGIAAQVTGVDFARIMGRMSDYVTKHHGQIRKGLEMATEMDFYLGEARFTGEYTLEVAGQRLKGGKIFLASGARPSIPAIPGLDTVPYLTNETLLQLKERPESLVIIGGGYIAAEFAHFFEAMGTTVTIVQRNERLVPQEEPEVSALLEKSLGRRLEVLTATTAVAVSRVGREIAVEAEARRQGERRRITAQQLLLAVGRTSNADLLAVAKTGVDTDANGYITVNEFLETSQPNIWAIGDAIGQQMFRHTANYEVDLVWANAVHGEKRAMDFTKVPHAVFSWPEIASVGLTAEQAVAARGAGEVLVGHAFYDDVARGQAMMESEGFAKAVVERRSGTIMGFHLIGPQASILIQEVTNAMALGVSLWGIAQGMHIHPALPELVLRTFANLRPAEQTL